MRGVFLIDIESGRLSHFSDSSGFEEIVIANRANIGNFENGVVFYCKGRLLNRASPSMIKVSASERIFLRLSC